MRTPEDTPTDADQLIRFGTVASVDLASTPPTCVVKLDDDAMTAPIRWIETRMGKTRTWSPPSLGEQVVLLCPAGEIGAAVALRGLVCAAFPAPGDSLKELIAFDDGAVISYDPEAHVLLAALPEGATAEITAPGGLTLNCDVTITGTLAVSKDADFSGKVAVTGEVTASDAKAGTVSLKGHVHAGVAAGTSKTAPPQ